MWRWLRGFTKPPLSTARALVATALVFAAVGVIVFVVAFVATLSSLHAQLGSLAGDYFEAIGEGDGEGAYSLLCESAKGRTTPEELASLGARAGGVAVESDSLRGSGPKSFWPWTDEGVGGVRLRLSDKEVTRYIEMRNESGWKVCPDARTHLLGRPPH